MPETLKSGAKQSASRVYGKRVLTSDEGYNIQAAKEEKKAEELREKEKRNERGKRKGSRKRQESFVQLKLKVRRRLTKKTEFDSN